MFTIKLYRNGRQKILAAESFTILRSDFGPRSSGAEITLHFLNGEGVRYDIGDPNEQSEGWPDVFDRAIIENAAGKTTEIINFIPSPPKLDRVA